MRLGELMDTEVVDVDGRAVGRVRDVRLVQDGPVRGFDAALRVDGLVVGSVTAALRLGYHRRRMRGPALLRWVLHRAASDARFVPWREVEHLGTGEVRLRCAAAALPHLHDEPT